VRTTYIDAMTPACMASSPTHRQNHQKTTSMSWKRRKFSTKRYNLYL